jgi:hypothetical protein
MSDEEKKVLYDRHQASARICQDGSSKTLVNQYLVNLSQNWAKPKLKLLLTYFYLFFTVVAFLIFF